MRSSGPRGVTSLLIRLVLAGALATLLLSFGSAGSIVAPARADF